MEDGDKKKKISAVVVVVIVVVHHCIVKSFDVVEVKRRVQKDFHIVPAPEGLVSSHVCHQHGNIPRGIPKKHTHKKKEFFFFEKLDREKKKTNFFL